MNSLMIKKVLLSEKSFTQAGNGKYTFVVDKNADKDMVAKVCEELFGVKVLSVNSMNYNGKIKMTKRIKGKKADFKKVVLTLKKGDKIDLFEIETPEAKKEEKKTEKKKEAVVKEKEVAAKK